MPSGRCCARGQLSALQMKLPVCLLTAAGMHVAMHTADMTSVAGHVAPSATVYYPVPPGLTIKPIGRFCRPNSENERGTDRARRLFMRTGHEHPINCV